MNKTQIAKNKGKQIKIRPHVRRIDPIRGELPFADFPWLVQDVTDTHVHLFCGATQHNLILGLDHIKEYMTDPGGTGGIFVLKSRIIARGSSLEVEPIV
jgi:hypothetical protein